MRPIVGNSKQEAKIADMGKIAHEMFPHIPEMVFRGTFRRAVDDALQEVGTTQWRDFANQPAHTRRRFFQRVLAASVVELKRIGLSDAQARALTLALETRNEDYLASSKRGGETRWRPNTTNDCKFFEAY